MTSSALAIDGAATAIAPSAAITYPSFFMLLSSNEWGFNIGLPGTFRGNRRRILNNYSACMNAQRERAPDRLLAFMLRRGGVAVGSEFAVLDGVFVLLVAIIHRAHGAVWLHDKSVFARL